MRFCLTTENIWQALKFLYQNQNDDEPFTYKDADEAIYQPRWMPFALIGVMLKL